MFEMLPLFFWCYGVLDMAVGGCGNHIGWCSLYFLVLSVEIWAIKIMEIANIQKEGV